MPRWARLAAEHGIIEAAGIVLGAWVPVILKSRADDEKARLVSCAAASLLPRPEVCQRTRRSGSRMTTQILTLNAGSSSLKFALFEADGRGPLLQASGQVEFLDVSPHCVLKSSTGDVLENKMLPAHATGEHEEALLHVVDALKIHFPGMHIRAVGHRVVHGGPRYAEPLIITPDIIAELEELVPLAPLHQPHNLSGIAAAHVAFPDALQIACFDTAFHRFHPWVNDTFALPRRYYEKGVRRYGFHGLSYEYVSAKLRQIAPDIAAGRVVIAHLGAGASMCAIRDGKSVASTMGFSPLDGFPWERDAASSTLPLCST